MRRFRFLVSMFAFAGILAGRIARDTEDVLWRDVANDAINAADAFLKSWTERGSAE